MLPCGLLIAGLDLSRDVEVRLPVPTTRPPSAQVLAHVAGQEPGSSLLCELPHVDEFMGEQGAVAAGVVVVAHEDPGADGHPVSVVRQERHLRHSNPSGELVRHEVVGLKFGSFEPAHTLMVGRWREQAIGVACSGTEPERDDVGQQRLRGVTSW